MMRERIAQQFSEKGLLPDAMVRHGIRRLLQQRLVEVGAMNAEQGADAQWRLLELMKGAPIAALPEKANQQHYEVPTAFYQQILGTQLKYSCAYWPAGVQDLDQAERAALEVTCDRAGIEDGMSVLELGCGWGSLTLWMAKQFPGSRITAVSNSRSQREHIEAQGELRGLTNLEVITADINNFAIDETFDRVVSVEMFEHTRNWPELFRRICKWMKPDGRFFMHIFAHRTTPYLFEDRESDDWMSRYFFSGGMMPSADLPMIAADELSLQRRWFWDGRHYEKTCNAWLSRMDAARGDLWPIMEETYGRDFASVWWMRWRIFFMACAELFAYNNGQEWLVGHYLFRKRDRD